MRLSRYLPILDWGRRYNGAAFSSDLMAAVIVTIMLIPQSLAYAMLAGLPPEAGLYASIAPLVAYAIFGTSRALAVGPVAVVSLMTAAAVGQIAETGTIGYATAALTLAFLSGVILLLMGVFQLGFLANFLSHPVISGFITASGVIIAASQLRYLLGVPGGGHTLLDIAVSLSGAVMDTNVYTLAVGAAALGFLLFVRTGLKPLLIRLRLPARAADIITKAGPVFAVAASIGAVVVFDLGAKGVAVVGTVPQGLPPFTLPSFELELVQLLLASAMLISVIGFVESVSVAQTLAAKKRERIDPDQELVALGASNVSASLSGGFPVTGGFARSVVNFDAGAATPAAGAFTAVGILLAAAFLTPLIYHLPVAVLAATIIVAVLSLVDFGALGRAFRYSKADFAAMAATIAVTLVFGVEAGVTVGVILSLALFLYRTSRPHAAVVGQVPGTEHFRNVDRHAVITSPSVVTLRVDESLYFANARYLEDRIYKLIADNPDARHVILMCPAVNFIDMSALESLEAINTRLNSTDVKLHLSEVKGPVMDRLKRSHFLDALTGEVFLSQYEAFAALDPETAKRALADKSV
ncbi:sulfate permease [Alkalicaulis satelles]|uniref:Sulfate permease n=1 Tax=Alkalicaulis satelles TaxID=2609175 RepID=A0A5M6Z8H4_9PROT|nr:sulfate permease [Alkalicaulis satelles]KAA5800932.1 sulfate permease [Alkalicaulis satelles]